MAGAADKAKGRAKEAAGALTGDKSLKAEGKTDQAVGKVKSGTQKAADKTKKAADKVGDKVGRATR